MQRQVRIGWPTVAAVMLGLAGGIAQIGNYELVSVGADTHAAIGVGLYFILAAGVPPLTGSQFRAVLHLPPWMNGILSAVSGALLLVLTTVHLDNISHETVAALVTVLSAWGWSAAVMVVSPRA